METLKDKGVEFFQVDKTEFVEKVQPLYDEVTKEPLIKDYIERIRNFE